MWVSDNNEYSISRHLQQFGTPPRDRVLEQRDRVLEQRDRVLEQRDRVRVLEQYCGASRDHKASRDHSRIAPGRTGRA
jgi:hypothetical protein